MHGSTEVSWALFTIGHSTRTIAEFVALLHQCKVDLVVDVRAFPRSRTNPQFNSEALSGSLMEADLSYRHLRALGGRRHGRRSAEPSPNALWRNESFRNYADYATTEAFRAGLDELLALIRDHCCAIMCSEAMWWRCHRRIIADYVLAEGISVMHIMGPNRVQLATPTPGVQRLSCGMLAYPGSEPDIAEAGSPRVEQMHLGIGRPRH
jgi:uncharacterized protein (DUF488 family)